MKQALKNERMGENAKRVSVGKPGWKRQFGPTLR
jgi:hypothetical protein